MHKTKPVIAIRWSCLPDKLDHVGMVSELRAIPPGDGARRATHASCMIL